MHWPIRWTDDKAARDIIASDTLTAGRHLRAIGYRWLDMGDGWGVGSYYRWGCL